jgi:hypothetical protein
LLVAVAGEAHIAPGLDSIVAEFATAITAHTFIADALIHQTITLFADGDTSVTHFGKLLFIITNKKREEIKGPCVPPVGP